MYIIHIIPHFFGFCKNKFINMQKFIFDAFFINNIVICRSVNLIANGQGKF